MFNRYRSTLAITLAMLAPWLASRAQSAQPSPYVRDFGYVTLHDGVKLAYVAYRPSAEGKFPTVMQYDPYVAAGSGPNPLFLDKGYAYVAVSLRGTGCSQGAFDFITRADHRRDGVAGFSDPNHGRSRRRLRGGGCRWQEGQQAYGARGTATRL